MYELLFNAAMSNIVSCTVTETTQTSNTTDYRPSALPPQN